VIEVAGLSGSGSGSKAIKNAGESTDGKIVPGESTENIENDGSRVLGTETTESSIHHIASNSTEMLLRTLLHYIVIYHAPKTPNTNINTITP
jgi:hypothetical protein